MRMSSQRKSQLYLVIHDEIVKARCDLKLPASDDARLAQREHSIWKRIRVVLNITDDECPF